METEGRNKQRIFHKILTYGAALILCSVVALIVLQLVGSSTGRDVSNENIVLTFIGILATFIVVGNFSQVKEVEDRIRKDFEELKVTTKQDVKERVDYMRDDMKDRIQQQLVTFEQTKIKNISDKLEENVRMCNNIPNDIKEYGLLMNEKVSDTLNKILEYVLEVYESKTMLKFVRTLWHEKKISCEVHIASDDSKNRNKAEARINEKAEIEFYLFDSSDKLSSLPTDKKINKVDNSKFDQEKINKIFALYKKLSETDKLIKEEDEMGDGDSPTGEEYNRP